MAVRTPNNKILPRLVKLLSLILIEGVCVASIQGILHKNPFQNLANPHASQSPKHQVIPHPSCLQVCKSSHSQLSIRSDLIYNVYNVYYNNPFSFQLIPLPQIHACFPNSLLRLSTVTLSPYQYCYPEMTISHYNTIQALKHCALAYFPVCVLSQPMTQYCTWSLHTWQTSLVE